MSNRIELSLNLAELRMLMQNDNLSKTLMEYLAHKHQELLNRQPRNVQLTGTEIAVLMVALDCIDSDLPEYTSILHKLESA